ncbi:DUF4271 domain-containing protein [Pseudopedobacter beijingensis]|uniref:DUF4271 domain-containing protein n=1 Tax=Pseudopedobacter beijingensis TaxID=1207056 RepID=A0ABW4I9S9_9SPHI
MIFKSLFAVIFLFLVLVPSTQAQVDSARAETSDTLVKTKKVYRVKVDSAALAQAQHMRDSLRWAFLRPDPHRENLFVKEMLEKNIIEDVSFLSLGQQSIVKKGNLDEGKPIKKYPAWEILILIFLIVCFGVLRFVFGKNMAMVFQAFYDDRILSQLNKEENIFSSWYFLFSYVLYSLFIGLFLYILFNRFGFLPTVEGFNLFVLASFSFAIALGVKIVGLRFLGFFFNVQRVTREYINCIYLSFFNVSLLFIPLIICLTLTSNSNYWVLWGGILFVALGFGLQLLRVVVHIMSSYKLSKFYLFLYLCAFELCPIIILIKALNI